MTGGLAVILNISQAYACKLLKRLTIVKSTKLVNQHLSNSNVSYKVVSSSSKKGLIYDDKSYFSCSGNEERKVFGWRSQEKVSQIHFLFQQTAINPEIYKQMLHEIKKVGQMDLFLWFIKKLCVLIIRIELIRH